MGTVVTFEVHGVGESVARSAVGQAVDWLHWVDATFSTYRADSEISRLGRGEITEAECHPDVRDVLARCEVLRLSSGGYFDARASGLLDPSGLVKGWSYNAAEFLSGQDYTHVQRWADKLLERPAVRRGRMVNRTSGEPSSQLRERHDASDFDTKTLDELVKER